MTSAPCLFCAPEPDRVAFEDDRLWILWDKFPVSPGHALVVPKRHIATWFDATAEEQHSLTDALAIARQKILAKHAPHAFNIGINAGAAAGQTVMHLHVHLIPRYQGDVVDPRGGIRHVIPSKGNYLAAVSVSAGEHARLSTGGQAPLLPLLERDLRRAQEADIAVAFVMRSGVDRLEPALHELLGRGGKLRLVTGDYLDITDPDALRRLLDIAELHPDGRVDLRVFLSAGTSFHPKSYIVRFDGVDGAAYVGSSNLSKSALEDGVEWNFRVIPAADRVGFAQVGAAFDTLFRHPQTHAVTPEWIDTYRSRRKVITRVSEVDAESERPEGAPNPHEIQLEALAALEATRSAGNAAGLVVLATGLGKTWLSAFDSDRPEFKKVLFVAHREEILAQAMKTFRRVRPRDRFGTYSGTEKDVTADVLFASIQTLGRQAHLDQFPRAAFDYVVVDEFHHASASTYRRLIQHFTPKFLLGLTATPERTDGGDLLQLCGENLVYRCDLDRGIEEKLLSPFHYFGVPDEVDYANIPWRSTKFDEEALTTAVATRARAQNAFEQWEKRGGRTSRTLGFCVSQRHANFMAAYFRERGVACAAVHSGPESDPRASSLEQLGKGELKVLFAVDIFNEGVDVPAIDAVMMLRPTESSILWLQQLGRGLRRDDANPHKKLTVIDYIGNHRVFLTKVRALLSVGSKSDAELKAALDAVLNHEHELPPGCEVTYELETVDILRGLLRVRDNGDAIREFYEDFKARMGRRPTAAEAFHERISVSSLRSTHGSWFRFVKQMGDLQGAQLDAFEAHATFLEELEKTQMTKSFKMLVLSALLNLGQVPGQLSIDELTAEFARLARGSQVYRSDVPDDALDEPKQLRRLVEQNPIAAWTGGKGMGGTAYFDYSGGVFRTTFNVKPEHVEPFRELLAELVELRLAEYQDRERSKLTTGFEAKITHNASGNPIIKLPERTKAKNVPEGTQTVLVDGKAYEGNFAKIALNALRRPEGGDNELPSILRGWYGPDVGKSGTNYLVNFEPTEKGVVLRPATKNVVKGPELWKRYMREQIPGLFGERFSEAIWNAGFVATKNNLFLLVTLEKGQMVEDFKYADHFVSSEVFQWQSQNRTTQKSKHGQLIHDHEKLGIAVQLFVRAEKKIGSAAAPFVYCGPVDFESWDGERPITVQWTLLQPLPPHLRPELKLK